MSSNGHAKRPSRGYNPQNFVIHLSEMMEGYERYQNEYLISILIAALMEARSLSKDDRGRCRISLEELSEIVERHTGESVRAELLKDRARYGRGRGKRKGVSACLKDAIETEGQTNVSN